MTTVFASFIVLALIVAAMAIGVIMGRAPIKGTCGGLNNGTADSGCSLCGGNPSKCEETAQ
jgi:hypothetical protein